MILRNSNHPPALKALMKSLPWKQSTLRVVDAASRGYQSSSVMEHVEPSAGESWLVLPWPAACCVFPLKKLEKIGMHHFCRADALSCDFDSLLHPSKMLRLSLPIQKGIDFPRHSVTSLHWHTSWTLPQTWSFVCSKPFLHLVFEACVLWCTWQLVL